MTDYNHSSHYSNQRDHIEQKLALLPTLPGIYLMKDANNQIIYVGKAKNLRNRVRSYFRGAHDTKTTRLVADIVDFETIVTNSDKEALILEINLIQEYKPQYNIRLKESTMYPYLKITHERDPQLIITNTVEKDGATYFGPFPNVYAATSTLDLLNRAYPLRRCGKNEKRACFYYHLGQCIGPCDHEVSPDEYAEQIKKIKRFFNGDVEEIKNDLKAKMMKASSQMEFELAADYRDQIRYIEKTVERQVIMSRGYDNIDVFGYTYDKGWISIQVFMLRQGSIIKRQAKIFPAMGEVEQEVTTYIARFYHEQEQLLPKQILVPSDVDHQLLQDYFDIPVTTPLRGKKRAMLELCEKNSRIALDERFRLFANNERRTVGAVAELAEALHIESAERIEAFDHSNIQGSHAVSGMVSYLSGQPERKNYRKFKIKTVEGANEYASTQEVIRRRYTRQLREGKELPDLILMDGGLIQVRAAKDILINELGIDIPVAGMVKDDRHRTARLLDGYTEQIVPLKASDPAFVLLQRIQEEVHRYAISYHRSMRSKSTFGSILQSIQGVGPKTQKKLLRHFKDLPTMRDADIDEYRLIGVPMKVAERIKQTLMTEIPPDKP